MRPASSASSLEPKKKPASAVTTIRKGNSAISVDSAMWLAMAQPSSARKCRKASMAIRNDSSNGRKGSLQTVAAFQIIHRDGVCKGVVFTSPRLRGEVDFRAYARKSGEGVCPQAFVARMRPLIRLAFARHLLPARGENDQAAWTSLRN